MKLNPDCVRAVLLAVEECPFNQTLNVDKLAVKLTEYSEEEIWYTCLKLHEGGYLWLEFVDIQLTIQPGIKCIIDLTYQGHEFLNTIRSSKVWEKTTAIAKSTGGFALKSLADIAGEIIKSLALAAISQL